MEEFDFNEIFSLFPQRNIDEKIIEKYQTKCDNILKIIDEEEKNYDKYFDDFSNRISRTEYSSKTLCVPRGFYCPSKIIDVISNAKRGKLIKRGQYDFVYNFDENGELIFVRRNNKKACEFIKRIGNYEIGITYRRRNKIEAITECEFYEDGRIKQYSYCYKPLLNEKSIEFSEEFYQYNKNNVEVTDTHFMCNNANNIVDRLAFGQYKYVFHKINETEFYYTCKQILPALSSNRTDEYNLKRAFPFKL